MAPRTLLLSAWSLIWLLNAFILAPAPLFPEIETDLGIGHAAAGALVSVFILPMVALQLPAGFVIDRWDNRKIVEGATAVLVASSVTAYLMPTYPVLISSRLVCGLCTTFIFVPCANLVTKSGGGDPAKRLALFLSAPAAGVALGTIVAPVYAHFWGWPAIFLGFTLPMVPLLLPFHLSAPRAIGSRGRSLGSFSRQLASQQLWVSGAAFAASYGAYIFFTSWMPSYLVSGGLVDRFAAGVLVGAGAGMGVLARPLGGVLALSRLGSRMPIVTSFIGLLPLALYLYIWGGAGALVAIVAGGFLAQLPFSVYYFYARDLLPGDLQGTALAFMNTTSLIGGFLVPIGVGSIVDATGSFSGAFVLLAIMSLVGAILALTLPGGRGGSTGGRGEQRQPQ